MLKCLFGNYLVDKKTMTKEQLDALLPVSKELSAEVEVIAVINKAISPADVRMLLGRMDNDSMHFGEMAIEAGYLSEEKLDEIQTYQQNSFLKFIQAALNEGIITLEQINPLLDDFQKVSGFTDAQLSSLVHDDLEECVNIFVPIKSPRLKELTLTLIQTLRRLIDPDLYLEKAYTAHSLQLDKYACQAIIGDLHIKVYISAPGDGLLAIANYFTGDKYDTVTTDALDNVGEFINCVNGLFATNLSYDDISIDMNSPEYGEEGPFVSNEKLYIIPVCANGYIFRAVFEVYE
ncbi:MAG: chemotaxis protein CheX [Roseburia sp.]|nr:chemotaxis protein CheX [Roseburia sp.]